MSKNEYLPFGSIVVLKGGTRKLIIIGVNQVAKENNKIYDYCACAYPFGYLNPNELFLFNNSNIDKVIFEGYSDQELNEFFEDISWLKEKNKVDGDKSE